jgi:hypothetical protein
MLVVKVSAGIQDELQSFVSHLQQVMDAISKLVSLHANKEVTLLIAYVLCPAKELQ